MARVLRRTVITGGVTYPAGEAETAKLAKVIPNPAAWVGDSDLPPAEDPDEEPPRGGAGSGKDVWRAYAERLGLEVPAEADRDDIVALVDARNTGE